MASPAEKEWPTAAATQEKQDGGKMGLGRYRDWLAESAVNIFIERPLTCFWSCCTLMVLLSAASLLGGMMTIMDQDRAWTIWDGEATQSWEALDYATDVVDAVPQESNSQSPGGRLRRLQQKSTLRRLQERGDDDDGRETFYLYYKESGSTFTPGSLKAICDLEEHLRRTLSAQRLESLTWETPLSLFYGVPLTKPPIDRQLPASVDCTMLSDDFVASVVEAMHLDVQQKLSSSEYAGFVHPTFLSSKESPVTSTRIEGESWILDDMVEDAQDRLGLKYGFLTSAYQGDDDRFTSMPGGTRVRLFYTGFDEFSKMISMDFGLAIISFVFVFAVMYAYIGSLFVACFGMLQIVLSLPLSALIYTGLFQIKYFEFLHILVVYLVLGIGADDIFVLVDTFKNIDAEQRGRGAWTKDGFRAILKAAYIRSASAILNTSFTTAMAFLASSGSKAMPMRTCGWYAAICIIMNFILTITFTPAVVVIWHMRFQSKRCCSLDWSDKSKVAELEPFQGERADSPGSDVEASHASTVESEPEKQGLVERALAKAYVPFMSYGVDFGCISVRPGSIFIVITMLVVAVQGIIFTSQLTPPRTAEEWFPDNHMAVKFSDFTSDATFSPDHENYAIIGVFWGISGLDKGDLDVYKPDDFEGGTVYDGAFDLSNPDAQKVVLETCDKLRRLTCTDDACKNQGYINRTLMMQSSGKSWSCFLEEFRDYIIWRDGAQAWPLPQSNFNDELKLFRANASGDVGRSGCCNYDDTLDKKYEEDIGFIGGELKYVQIRIRSTVQWDTAFGKGVDVRDLLKDWINNEVRSGVPGMGSVKFHGQGLFSSYDLGEELLNGLFQGCAIAAPIAFIVLLASTWNVVVSLYAVSCVGAIVVCVLGFCKSAMDWDLGIGEAIAGVIVLGYSVDYVVHLSHIYCEGGSHHGLQSRGERAAFAIRNMGSTVFAGAITTAGSAIVMFFCFFYFFTKMAILISVTIMYAFLFSLGLLMGLLWTVGPQGDFGNLAACCCFRSSTRLDKVVPHTDTEQPAIHVKEVSPTGTESTTDGAAMAWEASP